MMREDLIEAAARAIREELVRQTRDHERENCSAGNVFFEEQVSPYLAATAALDAILAKLENPDITMVSSAADFSERSGSGDFVGVFRAMLQPLKG